MALIRGTRFSDDLYGTSGDDTIEGFEGHDRLFGFGGNDRLVGGSGDDDLDGGSGQDRMEGGTGDDYYDVDSTGDQVVENAGEGIDRVFTSLASYTLGANVEDLVAISHADFQGTGNGLDNYMFGYDGDDVLDGADGDDVLFGDYGDDTFYIDDAGDEAVEFSGEGIDLVFTSLNTLTLFANVEEMIFDGAGAFIGIGNSRSNYIQGGAGNDRLEGRDGNDELNGGGGADQMIGGDGDDLFIVDNAGDRAIETSAYGGIDQVNSSISYTLGANVEDLVLTGTAAISGNGNGLANILIGNDAANVLNGRGGGDLMKGGGGNDIYFVDSFGDVVVETSATGGTDLVNSNVSFALGANVERLNLTGTGAIDGIGNGLGNIINGNVAANTIAGQGGNDALNGNNGNDRLFGGSGRDQLNGGAGADDYVFDTALNASTNFDSIVGFSSADDTIRLYRGVFSALPSGTVNADAFHAGATAQDAEDRIIYDAATGRIYYDADGTGAAAQVLFATVAAGTLVTNADFVAFG